MKNDSCNTRPKVWLWRIALLMALVIAGFTPATHATEHITATNIVVPRGHIVEDDLTAAGNSILIQGQVKGDVLAAGSSITLTGPVAGDVVAAGATIVVDGAVNDDLRAVGGNVTLLAPVGGNAMLAGGSLVLTSSTRVGRDADLAGGSVLVQGPIGRNLSVAAGEAQLSSKIGGDVTVRADKITLLPGTIIQGDLVVYSPRAPIIPPEAKVLGHVDFHKTEARQNASPAGPVVWLIGFLIGWTVRFLWILVLGMALLAFARPWVEGVAATANEQGAASLFAGFIEIIVVPVIIVLLMVTLIGIPLGLLLLAVQWVALLLSGVFIAHFVGGWLLRRLSRPTPTPYKQLAVGALALSFLMSWPLVGWLIQLATLFAGLGALLLERWNARSLQRQRMTSEVMRPAESPQSQNVVPA